MNDAQINLLSDIVMRQTDYDPEMAKSKVKEFNGNVEAIVREFMNPPPQLEQKKTVNQEIYGQIRGLMDSAAENFRKQQELNKLKEAYIKHVQSQQKNVVVDNVSKDQSL